MGKEAALFAYVLPVLVSTLGGATISVLALGALQKTHVFGDVKVALGSK